MRDDGTFEARNAGAAWVTGMSVFECLFTRELVGEESVGGAFSPVHDFVHVLADFFGGFYDAGKRFEGLRVCGVDAEGYGLVVLF